MRDVPAGGENPPGGYGCMALTAYDERFLRDMHVEAFDVSVPQRRPTLTINPDLQREAGFEPARDESTLFLPCVMILAIVFGLGTWLGWAWRGM